MFRIVKLMFRPTPTPTKTPLGRWNIHDNSEIKSILANYDNCGDTICKNPVELSKHIENAHNTQKNNNTTFKK